MRSPLPVALLLVALTGVAAAPASAADDRVIAQGVTAGGVALGGLTVDAAAAKLDAALGARLTRGVVLGAAGVPHRLSAAQAKLRFDALLTAKRAAGVKAPPPAPEGGGAVAGVTVPLALSHSRLAVKAWVAQVAARVHRPARSATLRITLRRMVLRRARLGKRLDQAATRAQVDAALADPDASRVLHQRLRTVRPPVNANDLRRSHRTVVTVDRSSFRLRLFKDLRLRRTYGIAVGMAGLDTPAGRYRIANKAVNPAWHVPNSAWAGSMAGQTVPGGAPNNPLKARWLGIYNGVGIHGTAEEWSIGSRASHGCIRMRVADVKDLYPRVPVGTPVLIR